jgi:predicted  nucleic acid-binding Zn-ribbon protein
MATAAAITDKAVRASELRTQIITLGQEITNLRERLEQASRTLGQLQEKRQRFTEEAARGKQPKVSEVADLNAALDQAQLPVDGLTPLLSSKQAAVAGARDSLASLEREIFLEAQRAAQIEEVKGLAEKGMECAQGVNTELGKIIVALTVYDELRRSLGQFIGPDPELTGIARGTLAAMQGAWNDGSFLREERKLLREGYTPGGVEFVVRSLRKP